MIHSAFLSKCRVTAAAAVLGVVLLGAAVPREARAGGPRFVVQAELAHGGNVVSVSATTLRPPYGVASMNGRRLKIECFQTGRAIYATYNPLFPVVYATYFAMQARLPSGQLRWILGSFFAPFASLIVRTQPGSGPCGTDALASANFAAGYVIIT